MSLEEYRERQRQEYLRRKRERELNGETEQEESEISQSSNLSSTTTAAGAGGLNNAQCCDPQSSRVNTASSSTETRNEATSSGGPIPDPSVRNTKPLNSPGALGDDTLSDGLLAQLLAAEPEEMHEGMDEASAAVIAQLMADEVETEAQDSEVRVADAVFQERLISEFHSPTEQRFPAQRDEARVPDSELARRLQEEEFLRDGPFSPRSAPFTLLPPAPAAAATRAGRADFKPELYEIKSELKRSSPTEGPRIVSGGQSSNRSYYYPEEHFSIKSTPHESNYLGADKRLAGENCLHDSLTLRQVARSSPPVHIAQQKSSEFPVPPFSPLQPSPSSIHGHALPSWLSNPISVGPHSSPHTCHHNRSSHHATSLHPTAQRTPSCRTNAPSTMHRFITPDDQHSTLRPSPRLSYRTVQSNIQPRFGAPVHQMASVITHRRVLPGSAHVPSTVNAGVVFARLQHKNNHRSYGNAVAPTNTGGSRELQPHPPMLNIRRNCRGVEDTL